MTDRVTVAIAGMGAVGGRLARELNSGGLAGSQLAAVSDRYSDKARTIVGDVPVVPLAKLAGDADFVIECIPSEVFDDVAIPVVEVGRTLVVMTGSALLERQTLIDRSQETGARTLLPSGAMVGIDVLKAAAGGDSHGLHIARIAQIDRNRKPVIQEQPTYKV